MPLNLPSAPLRTPLPLARGMILRPISCGLCGGAWVVPRVRPAKSTYGLNIEAFWEDSEELIDSEAVEKTTFS